MESLGTLAGGIAHDFNNILSAILGSAELALMRFEKGKLKKSDINNIMKAGLRASDLVKQILSFGKIILLKSHL